MRFVEPESPGVPAFRTFSYLRFAKTAMGGATYPLCLSGVPSVQPFSDEELARLAARYDLPPSLAAWREAIGARYGVPPSHAWPAYGTSGAVHLALGALLAHETPRRPIAVERPAYGVFETCAALFGSETVDVERSAEQDYAIDLDAVDAAFERGAAVFCCTDLHNPTGVALSAAEIAALDEIAARHGAWVLVDEVYRDALPGPVGTAYRPGSRIVAVGSLTKCYGLGPQRAGWIFGPPEVLDRAEAVEEAVCGVPPGPWLALVAATVGRADELLAKGRALAEQTRPVVDRWVAATPRVAWTPPKAGITGLLQVEGLRDSGRFAQRLREEHDVQVVPGSFFDAPGTIRISWGLPQPTLDEALARLGRAIAVCAD